MDGDGFVAQLQQTGLFGHPQLPVVLLEIADGLAQPLAEGTVLVHVDGVADKFVDVSVVAGPELDALLTPAGDDVKTTLQGVGELLDMEQIVAPLRRFLNVEQPRLQAVAGSVQGILQLAQGLAGLVQQLFAAVNGIDPVLGQQGRDFAFDLILLLIHGALGEIDAPQGLFQREGEARQHLGIPLLAGVGLERRLAGGVELGSQVFEQNGELDGVNLTLIHKEVDDAHTQARQTVEALPATMSVLKRDSSCWRMRSLMALLARPVRVSSIWPKALLT